MWSSLGYFGHAWASKLTEAQRQRWSLAGGKVLSASRLGCGPLTGEQHFCGVNAARACIGLPPLWEPPEQVVFSSPSPVGQLTIVNDQRGVRLLLSVTGPVTEPIMVFGQAPCSAGRMVRRNVAYLGLLPPPTDGQTDITEIYAARYGVPRPGTKVFLVTRQQQNGWEGADKETNAIVPAAPEGAQAPVEGQNRSKAHMYTGCTGPADELAPLVTPYAQEGAKPAVPGANATKWACGSSEMPNAASSPAG